MTIGIGVPFGGGGGGMASAPSHSSSNTGHETANYDILRDYVAADTSRATTILQKGRGENRTCTIVDSPSLAEGDATFSIGPNGIDDAKDL